MKQALVGIFWLVLFSPGNAQTELHYGVSGTHLTGHVRTTWQYGPPGFGETSRTDPKVKFAYLLMGKPITVSPAVNVAKDDPDADMEKNVRKIRLWCFEKPHCGTLFHMDPHCKVTLEGQLHHGVAPLDFYNVTMDVEKIVIGECSKQ